MSAKKQKTIKIKAVCEDDLKGFMKKIGLWKDYKKGKLKCGICGAKICNENLAAFKPINNEPKAICDKCLITL